MDVRRWPGPLPPVAGRLAVVAAVAFSAVGVGYRLGHEPGRVALTVAAGLVSAVLAPVIVLRSRRLLPFGVPAIGVAVTVTCNGSPSNVGWFALLVLVAWCALTAPLLGTALVWIGATALFVVEALVSTPDPGWFAWIAGTAASVLACLFGRRQRELVAELREAQEGLRRQAHTEERSRIARELHDVIAHSLTVSLLHVSAARLALADDPADAERALAEAERLGRASLDEVRHAVGTLRTADGVADPTAPLPGSTDLPALIAGFRSAGAQVEATVDTDLDAVPGTVGLAAYRIVQEALTNAVKHAPGRPASVRVSRGDGVVRVEVDSAGDPGSGTGLGLLGMRERAASVGGTCTAGPAAVGWRVHAELPLPGDR